MSRFFVDETAIQGEKINITDRDDMKHISKVLRMNKGDFLDISDSKKYEYRAEIQQIAMEGILCHIHSKQLFAREPKIQITLFQGVPKQGKMETIIQKTVELGVGQITPVFTSRCVVADKGNFDKKIERWQKISDEAVKQCKRGMKPKVNSPLQFYELAETLQNFQLILFPYENEEEITIKHILRKMKGVENVAIIIGPEGGFTEEEAESIKNIGGRCVTLGKTILRTETAGMAALAMTMYELEL
ncbi:MAG: RsmE family RNA methyltransferase [Anaerovorax sp.]